MYQSNGRPVGNESDVPLTDEIMAALAGHGLAPYIADLAGGCFAVAVDVAEWEVLAGNADGWLPSDHRGGHPYGAVVSANPCEDSGDPVIYLERDDDDAPATAADFVSAVLAAVAAIGDAS